MKTYNLISLLIILRTQIDLIISSLRQNVKISYQVNQRSLIIKQCKIIQILQIKNKTIRVYQKGLLCYQLKRENCWKLIEARKIIKRNVIQCIPLVGLLIRIKKRLMTLLKALIIYLKILTYHRKYPTKSILKNISKKKKDANQWKSDFPQES